MSFEEKQLIINVAKELTLKLLDKIAYDPAVKLDKCPDSSSKVGECFKTFTSKVSEALSALK